MAQPTQNVDRIVSELNEKYGGKDCVVSLRMGSDKLGQAVMRMEKAYVDDSMPTTRTLRVVGHLPGSQEHATMAIPLQGGLQVQVGSEEHRFTVMQGEMALTIAPVEFVATPDMQA